MSEKPRILITGSAGFIGSNVLSTLKKSGHEVRGIDNYSPYYSPEMKQFREMELNLREDTSNMDLANFEGMREIFRQFNPTVVINLAAQGGVRASRIDPMPYIESNQIGFLNLLELSRKFGVSKFIYASSSSVYGDSIQAPFKEILKLPAPKNLYALSKLSNEIIAENFESPGMEKLGLRFFTVYGPWGRPDMAIFRILASSLLDKEFLLTASPQVMRDFTFVDDVSKVIIALLQNKVSDSGHEIFNVAGGNPYSLQQLFETIENFNLTLKIVQSAQDKFDVKLTHGAVDKLQSFGLPVPDTSLVLGVKRTLSWMEKIDSQALSSWFEYREDF
jgi:UDP-glucuronate 4-epimerase